MKNKILIILLMSSIKLFSNYNDDNTNIVEVFSTDYEIEFANIVDCPIDTSISVNNGVLMANVIGSYTYQWLDCDNANSPISSETNQSFTPTISGNYAVEIDDGVCSVVSICVSVNCSQLISVNNLLDENDIGITEDLSVDVWHHFALTKASDRTGQIFIDGIKVSEGTFQDLSYNYSALYIAASYFSSTWSGHVNSWIDELRVSNIVRSVAEISNHYNSGVELAVDANTIGLWHFNESSGTSFANEVSGNGTLVNGAYFTPAKFGNGAYFDGVNDRGDCNIDIPEDNITIEFWVKLNGEQSTSTIIQPYGINSTNIGTGNICDISCPIDNTVSENNGVLIASATGSYTYQWLDCDNNNLPISGETGQSYAPLISGNYTVQIDDGNCSVESDCTSVSCNKVSVNNLLDENGIGITEDLSVDVWHHFALTKASDRTGQIFIDGVKVSEGIFEDLNYNYSALYLAASYFTSWSGHVNGWIDELRVSNKVRSVAEIANHYNSGVELAVDANTIGLWHFNESSGTDFANEISGNGTLINGAYFTPSKFGNGAYFDGVNDRGNCNIDIPEDNITIEFWVKLDGEQSTSTIIQPYGVNSTNIGTGNICETLDVSTFNDDNMNINLFPNPIDRNFSIYSQTSVTRVEIYTIFGEKVKEIKSEFNSISIDNLSSGMYIVLIHSDKGVVTRKIIKK